MAAMTKIRLIVLSLVLTLLPITGTPPALSSTATDTAAAETKGDSVTLDSLIKEALRSNPMIKSAKFDWGAAIEKLPQASGLPDPMLSFTYFPEPIETKLGPNDMRIMLTQPIPYLKKLSLKESIAGSDAKIASLKFKREIRGVVTSVSESYFELTYINKAQELTGRVRGIFEEIAKIGAADYAADTATLNDLLTAQSKLAQLNYDYLLLEELKEVETGRLNGLLNRPPESDIGDLEGVAVSLKYGLTELYEISENNLEEIEMLDTSILKMEEMTDLAKLSSYPDFKFSLLYSQIGKPEGMQPEDAGRDAYGVTVGMTLPIWGGKNSAKVREKSLKKRALIEMRNNRINMTNAKIKNLYFKMNSAKRLMALYKNTLIPQAADTMLKAEEWYKQKGASYIEFLETQSVWLNFNIAYHRATADYNKYGVSLMGLLGIDLVYENTDAKGGE